MRSSSSPPLGTKRILLWIVGTLSTAIFFPVLAHWHVSYRIHSGVLPAVARKLGSPVSVSSIAVAVTGTLTMKDVTVGHHVHISVMESSIRLTALLRGMVQLERIHLWRPHVKTHIDVLGQLFSSRSTSPLRMSYQKSSDKLPIHRTIYEILHVDRGRLSIFTSNGRVILSNMHVAPGPLGLRISAPQSSAEILLGSISANIRFPQLAADITSQGLQRFAATNGTFVVTGNGNSIQFQPIFVRHGIFKQSPGGLHVAIQSAKYGNIVLDIQQENHKDVAIGARIYQVPAGILRPVAPSVRKMFPSGRVSGNILATFHSLETLSVQASLHAQGTLSHPRVATQPIPFATRASIRATITDLLKEEGILQLHQLKLAMGSLSTDITGSYQWSKFAKKHQVDLAMEIPRNSCADAFRSIPAPWTTSLQGIQLRGSWAAQLRLSFNTETPAQTRLAANIDMTACRATSEATSANPKHLRRVYTHTYPDGSQRRIGIRTSHYASLDTLPAHISNAFVFAEDSRFFQHGGFDAYQLEKSLGINLQHRQVLRGGSTITQQLVKNVFLTREKTLARKFQEAVLTWRTEKILSKRRILELYLNIIELGPGIFGVPSGARYWFQKTAQTLTIREAAFLAALTPAPRTLSARIRQTGHIEPVMQKRINVILYHLLKGGAIRPQQYTQALQQQLLWKPRKI